MNYERSLIFAYLEEDNVHRAYFRVRPLLTSDGDIRHDAISLWPNEGGLRIVPDKNEQHTFKARMRTLGSYCVVDLRGLPAEAGKIRTNKNFRPDRGETNQYILYSDTVHELPDHTFYELLAGAADDYAALAEKAITPKFYIRQDDTIFGPVSKKTPAKPETAAEAAGVLFELNFPDNVTRQMLYMNDEPTQSILPPKQEGQKPDSKPQVQAPDAPNPPLNDIEAAQTEDSESLAIGEKLHILDESKGHEDTLVQLNKPVSSTANLLRQPEKPTIPIPEKPRRNEPLSGTPLIRTPLHVAVQQPKNKTQEIVSSQWSVGRYESPASNLPAGTKLRTVDNPVETACLHLREAWNASSAHHQLTDFILSLDGIRTQLEIKLCEGKTGTIMQRVLQQRLQDLEAERLSALCELDKAKRDVDTYKQELLSSLSARVQKEIQELEADKKCVSDQLLHLKEEENALLLQRDALIAKIEELQKSTLPEAAARLFAEAQLALPTSGTPLRLTPVSGHDTSLEELITRLTQACADAGIDIDRNTAVAIIVLLAVCPRIGISCSTTAAASTLLRNIACAMGWQSCYAHQFSAEQQPLVGIRPADATPAILTTNLPNYAPIKGITKLLINRTTAGLVRNAAYDVSQWPILSLPPLSFVAETETSAKPVSASSLSKLNESSVSSSELNSVLLPILKAAIPLSGTAQKEMFRFVSIAAALMEGGLPAAADWAILLWIIPALESSSKHHAAVKALLDEYPLSLSKL